VRRTADIDRAFWSNPEERGTSWLTDPDTASDDERRALDDLAQGNTPIDRIFHELRDLAPERRDAGHGSDAARASGRYEPSRDGEPDDDLPPAAFGPAFAFDASSDDLLPHWPVDLG
jgi:hypothetical protein